MAAALLEAFSLITVFFQGGGLFEVSETVALASGRALGVPARKPIPRLAGDCGISDSP